MDAESKLKIICGLLHRVLSSYSIQQHCNAVHKRFCKLLFVLFAVLILQIYFFFLFFKFTHPFSLFRWKRRSAIKLKRENEAKMMKKQTEGENKTEDKAGEDESVSKPEETKIPNGWC